MAPQCGTYRSHKLIRKHCYKLMPFTASIHLMIYRPKPRLRLQRTKHRFLVRRHGTYMSATNPLRSNSIHSFADSTLLDGSFPLSTSLRFHSIPTAFFPLSSTNTLIFNTASLLDFVPANDLSRDVLSPLSWSFVAVSSRTPTSPASPPASCKNALPVAFAPFEHAAPKSNTAALRRRHRMLPRRFD